MEMAGTKQTETRDVESEPLDMLTATDWEYRAASLHDAAARLTRMADGLHAEAGLLRNRAIDCENEMKRLQDEAAKTDHV